MELFSAAECTLITRVIRRGWMPVARWVIVATTVFTSFYFLPIQARAVDSSQLWLPRNYYRHYKHLLQAVRVAEDDQKCRYVIAGTLAQNRSSLEHPVFKVTCRDDERKTFAYLVDGLNYDILNRPAPPPPPDPEQLAAQALNQRLDELWRICSGQLAKRTQGLRGVTWLSTGGGLENRPEALVRGDENIKFEVLFDAVSRRGNLLHYRAVCHFDNSDKDINVYAKLPEAESGSLDEESARAESTQEENTQKENVVQGRETAPPGSS